MNKKVKIGFSLTLCFILNTALGQQKNYTGFPSLVWPKLYEITYVKKTDKNGDYDKPVFSEAAKSLNGKTISLPGYIVPFEGGLKSSSHFMFSSMPLSACFFCGVGGPESAVEVFTKEKITYTDKPVEISGVLRLNDDPDSMIYVLEKAEVLGPVEY
jgi:hypothetical protein